MAQYFFDPAVGETAPVVVAGKPPTDQSALVAQLQAENAFLTAKVAEMQLAIDGAQKSLEKY
jgi:hypothetical protein